MSVLSSWGSRIGRESSPSNKKVKMIKLSKYVEKAAWDIEHFTDVLEEIGKRNNDSAEFTWLLSVAGQLLKIKKSDSRLIEYLLKKLENTVVEEVTKTTTTTYTEN